MIWHSARTGIYLQDSLWYHLPTAARFAQTGEVFNLHITDPMELMSWFYPMNIELLHSVGIVWTGSDYLSTAINSFFLLVCLVAAWLLGRIRGAGLATLSGVAILFTGGIFATQAGNAPTDLAGLAFLLSAAALLRLAVAEGGSSARTVAVAGLAAGLAVGTKLTLLAPIGIITLGLTVNALIRGRRLVVAAWWAGLVATGSAWYLRNLMHSGNPFPWLDFGFLPSIEQQPLYPRSPHSVAEYLGEGDLLGTFGPGLGAGLGPLWPVILGLAVLGLGLALVRGGWDDRILACAGIAALVAYVFVPISASGPEGNPVGFESNLRYLAPALALGLVLLPSCLEEGGLAARWLTKTLVLIFAANFLLAGEHPAWAMLIALIPAFLFVWLRGAPSGRPGTQRRGDRGRRVPAERFRGVGPWPAPALVWLVGLVGSAALIATLSFAQSGYAERRYDPMLIPPEAKAGLRGTVEWAILQGWAREQRGARIGISGPAAAFGQYIFYGQDLTNYVQYLTRQRPDGGQWPIEDCHIWRKTINANRFDFVVVTSSANAGPHLSQERIWLESDRMARLLIPAGPFSVYRIEGPLSPGQCPLLNLPPTFELPNRGYLSPDSN